MECMDCGQPCETVGDSTIASMTMNYRCEDCYAFNRKHNPVHKNTWKAIIHQWNRAERENGKRRYVRTTKKHSA